ncbi:MAG: N-acetyltransferase [Thermoguttaceae bacterium]|nr:N-acetyltransferase [Thermoguttaceae bacterium]MBP3695338.1 N-acetyltransferase [Thermoguttaceae bacterium]
MIRIVTPEDAPQLLEVYGHYVLNTTFTTEEILPSVEEMAERVRRVTQKFPWLGFEENGRIVGYCYADIFRTRTAWHRTAELSIYVHPNHVEGHVGHRLYEELFRRLEKNDEIHSVVACITLPNERSVRLHESFGLIKKAHLPEVGFKFGCWMDVGLWHRVLEEKR